MVFAVGQRMQRVVDDWRKVGSHAACVDERDATFPSLDAKAMPLSVTVKRRKQPVEQQGRTSWSTVARERGIGQPYNQVDIKALALRIHGANKGPHLSRALCMNLHYLPIKFCAFDEVLTRGVVGTLKLLQLCSRGF